MQVLRAVLCGACLAFAIGAGGSALAGGLVSDPGDFTWADTVDGGDVAALQAIYQEWGLAFDFGSSRLTGDDPPKAGITNDWEYEAVYDEMDLEDPSDDVLLGYRITQQDRVNVLTLTVSVPQAIGGLSELDSILGDRKNLTGSIPSSVGSLSKLTYVNLTGNDLSGEIPASLGQLGQLETLDLSNNDLTGSIPETLAGMSSLQDLVLNDNQLSGSIPSSLGSLPALESLRLQNNQLSGELPASLGQLSTLVALDLDDNDLAGSIPASLGDLAALGILDLSYNQFSGPIPASLGNLGELGSLNLSYNELEGPVPGALASLDASLRLQGNFLSGTLPANLGEFAASTIFLANNFFNAAPGNPSSLIVSAIGGSGPAINGFGTQRTGVTLIEGLAATYEAAEGSGVFIGPLTVTNQSPATGITGTLSVAADGFLGEPVVSPAGDVSLAPGEARQFSIFLPIGTAGTPPGDYIMDVSFEGATFSTAAITIIEPVGTVTEITGVVNVQPADGEMRALGLGDPIFANDTIITGAGAMARIEFADESSFEVFENAKLAIDDYVYDPEASANNRVDFSILRGVFLFTSGLIGRDDPDNINIDTPHGGIGIRGTEFTVDVSDDGTNALIEIEVTEGTVVFTDFYTGEVTEIPAGESHQSTAPLPSLETVRLSVNRVGDPALDLAGYTDAAFTVQRSTDLKTWDDWREVQASELPLSIPETSGEDAVFYRLAR